MTMLVYALAVIVALLGLIACEDERAESHELSDPQFYDDAEFVMTAFMHGMTPSQRAETCSVYWRDPDKVADRIIDEFDVVSNQTAVDLGLEASCSIWEEDPF